MRKPQCLSFGIWDAHSIAFAFRNQQSYQHDVLHRRHLQACGHHFRLLRTQLAGSRIFARLTRPGLDRICYGSKGEYTVSAQRGWMSHSGARRVLRRLGVPSNTKTRDLDRGSRGPLDQQCACYPLWKLLWTNLSGRRYGCCSSHLHRSIQTRLNARSTRSWSAALSSGILPLSQGHGVIQWAKSAEQDRQHRQCHFEWDALAHCVCKHKGQLYTIEKS